MGKRVSCEVRCLACKEWFKFPINFSKIKSYLPLLTVKNATKCLPCGTMVNCSKDNVRFRHEGENGIVHYYEGKDVFEIMDLFKTT